MAEIQQTESLQDFLQPLSIDLPKIIALAQDFGKTYRQLAAESENQFLPTPISDSILRPSAAQDGRYLAIDIGGTNLRVGFIELLNLEEEYLESSMNTGVVSQSRLYKSRVTSRLERSWPIGEQLKHEKAKDLFAWIGDRIADVVENGVKEFGLALSAELPLGVTFSFPMIQHTLSDATLMSMGKGFAITSNLDLGNQLRDGYSKARLSRNLPSIKLVAIVNDTVATLIAFSYQLKPHSGHKAAMGLVVGTGTNATIPIKLDSLHTSKRPKSDDIAGTKRDFTSTDKVVVNTEWSIKGAAGPLHAHNLITRWDQDLDAASNIPGFQPFEYMTAGRYLGELGRLIILDYFTSQLGLEAQALPPKLRQQNGLTTTFLGSLQSSSHLLDRLATELPPREIGTSWHWTEEAARTVLQIAKVLELRAAAMTAAAIIGLLICAEEIDFDFKSNGGTDGQSLPTSELEPSTIQELIVGYTGLCIENFQDFLNDCQRFLDEAMNAKFKDLQHPMIVLQAFHDGGLVGAGVLAGTAVNLAQEG